VLFNLFGPVRRTAAIRANVTFERNVEDTAAVLLQFERGPCASLAVTHASGEKQDTLHVWGTRGAVHADDLNAGHLRIDAGGRERLEAHPPASNIHRPLIDDFVDAVRSGRDPAVDGATGRAVTAIEDDIYAVSPTGR
jgi:predicted dehydrogenase